MKLIWAWSCLLITIIVAVAAENTLYGQWPEDRQYTRNRFIKSIEYNSSISSKSPSNELFIENTQYDSVTGDFFYLGVIGTLLYSDFRFISRTNMKGEMIWTTLYSKIGVFKSLQYSPTNQIVYLTVLNLRFTLFCL